MTARVYASYAAPDLLLAAIGQIKAQGYHHLEAYSPFPIAGLADALEYPPSRIPRLIFVVGLVAATVTYFVQWLLDAYLYPINVGARPPHFPLSYVPVCFEVGILCAALTAVGGVVVAGRLGRLWDPVFELDGFGSATRDRYWLQLSLAAGASTDPVEQALRESGAEHVITSGSAPCDA